MFLFVFCLRNKSSIKYLRNWGNGEGVTQKVHRCVQGGMGITPQVYHTHLHYFFSCLCFMVLLNLTFIQISFFYFKLFIRTKVSQNAFHSNYRCTLYFSVIPYFEKILCSIAHLINYFTSIFTELVLYYCHFCYCYLMLLLRRASSILEDRIRNFTKGSDQHKTKKNPIEVIYR